LLNSGGAFPAPPFFKARDFIPGGIHGLEKVLYRKKE
jgi:hypothetical protein